MLLTLLRSTLTLFFIIALAAAWAIVPAAAAGPSYVDIT
jgi:hypothetical protein